MRAEFNYKLNPDVDDLIAEEGASESSVAANSSRRPDSPLRVKKNLKILQEENVFYFFKKRLAELKQESMQHTNGRVDEMRN